MSSDRVGQVEHQLCRLLELSDAHTADGQLLEAFIANRDEAAFAALVRRYSPMILGVCRRLLRHEADVEDAFQVAFLVLVRRAAQIRNRATLGNWLYGVAYRTALHARTMNARRCRLESQAPARQSAVSPEEAAMQPELQQLLDRELNRLPNKYREIIVLCDLVGKTKREAALQLDCPEGTVSSRLARGHEILRKRLAQHGRTLSVAALAGLLAQNKAPASITLIDTTTKAAALVAAGNLAAASGLVPKAAVLLEGVLKSMLLTKLKITAGVVLLIAVLGGTTSLIACRSLAGPQAAPAVAPPVGAQEEKAAQPKKVDKPPVDRGRLRYDGKDFAYWQDLLRTELRPASRMEAFRALGAFGVHGYADEVTETILELVRDFDPRQMNDEDWGVYQTAGKTLARIGLKALPAITKAYENGNKEERTFVVSTLSYMGSYPEVVPLLLRAAKDKDSSIRLSAVQILAAVNPKSKRLVAVLTGALTDEDANVRQAAANLFYNYENAMGTAAKVALPDLGSAALKDKSSAVRQSAIQALIAIRPEPGTLVPLLAAFVEDKENDGFTTSAFEYFRNLGPNDKDSVPALIEVLKNPRLTTRLRRETIVALGGIGPPAKEAVPVLLEILGDKECDLETRDLTAQVLKKIQRPLQNGPSGRIIER